MAWIPEGNGADFIVADTCIEYSKAVEGSNIFNAKWNEPIKSGEEYFEFTYKAGSRFSVGVTNDANFKAGWGLSGFLYNGNVTSGGGAIITDFGPRPVKDDVVGVLLDLSKGFTVTFYYNGQCLGPAYKLATAPTGPFYPVVAFHAKGDKCCIGKKSAPSQRERKTSEGPFPTGTWKINKIDGGTMQSIAMVTLTKEDQKMKVSAKIANRIATNLDIKSETEYVPSGQVVSTKLMGDEQQMKDEKTLSSFMEAIINITKTSGGIEMKASSGTVAEGVRAEISFTPHSESVLKCATTCNDAPQLAI